MYPKHAPISSHQPGNTQAHNLSSSIMRALRCGQSRLNSGLPIGKQRWKQAPTVESWALLARKSTTRSTLFNSMVGRSQDMCIMFWSKCAISLPTQTLPRNAIMPLLLGSLMTFSLDAAYFCPGRGLGGRKTFRFCMGGSVHFVLGRPAGGILQVFHLPRRSLPQHCARSECDSCIWDHCWVYVRLHRKFHLFHQVGCGTAGRQNFTNGVAYLLGHYQCWPPGGVTLPWQKT
jgi:hypothetical protein